MAEYIERENAYKLIREQKEKETGMYSKGRNTGLNIAKSIIHNKEQCPTADVVKVVRCKDCKHFIASKPAHCKYHTDNAGYCDEACWVTENDFCSYGELKECEGK
jgi:hypothetical protein